MEVILGVIKNIILIILITLPPWISLVSLMKKKKSNSQIKFLIIGFVVYMGVSLYTDNILPTIVSLIYLRYVYINNEETEEKYYLRPLKNKRYKLKFLGKTFTITFAKERTKIIGISLIFKIIVTVISFWILFLIQMNGIQLEEQVIVGEFLNASTVWSLYLSMLMVVTAPILEEFIFRHMFYRLISKKTGKIISAILTSVVFTLLHYNVAGIFMFFSVGMFNCYLYDKYGYRAAVINHFIFNITSLISLVFMKSFI
ncbi:MAG: type II CAAX endopeptidase family protein [Clostridium sp.]